jgi:hypothetical protein
LRVDRKLGYRQRPTAIRAGLDVGEAEAAVSRRTLGRLMTGRLAVASLVVLSWLATPVGTRAPQAPGEADRQADGVVRLLQRLERLLAAGDPAQYSSLLSRLADADQARRFASVTVLPGVTRVTIRERDRAEARGALPGNGYVVSLEVLTEFGTRARLATWRLDVRRGGTPGSDDEWGIARQEVVSSIQWLHRLSLDAGRQFAVRDFAVKAEDFELRLARGAVFIANTDQGIPLLVLVGDGEMVFSPAPATERGQMKIFAGSETLRAAFDVTIVRVNPDDLENHLSKKALVPTAVDARVLRRADEFFRAMVGRSFSLNLTDLSAETWSLVPGFGDFLAEVRTKKYATLTYARSNGEAEDVTLFDRAKHRNIALYASAQRLALRGPFYDEDELADYDVLDYDVVATFVPNRQRLDGQAAVRLRVKRASLTTLTLRLAESLAVRSVTSPGLGRLLALQVRNQNSTVVTFPAAVPKDTVLTLLITYGGQLAPDQLDRESVSVEQDPTYAQDELSTSPIALEPTFLYSNRAYWYPQSPVTDYATARLRISVPPNYVCAASGDRLSSAAIPAMTAANGKPSAVSAGTEYVFTATQPLRYLSCLITRLVPVQSDLVSLEALEAPVAGDGAVVRAGVFYRELQVIVQAHPRAQSRARQVGARASDIARFYTSLVGDCPYPTLTVSLVERDLPGGHSPAYMIALATQVPGSRLTWRNDPAAFDDYPEFFLAHEVAHQWWGQAVGWKNYHEQWLSEGLAQYFAALYAERQRGPDVFAGIVRRLARWGIEHSDRGPVYLGYRVGHLQGDGRINRAVVYNKSAATLHMLRRLLGDEVFFGGIRHFYNEWRFRKAGTDDLRRAFEKASGKPLGRFFDRWIYNAALPRVKFTSKTERVAGGEEAVLQFEQSGDVFDLPVSVTLRYANGTMKDVIVPLTARTAEMRVPLTGPLAGIDVNRDGAALAHITR